MRVLDIIPGTTVDGPGLRTSIYFAGCHHDCPGCHNPQSHDPAGGREVSEDELMARIEEEDFDVTFTGGDPMFQARELLSLAKRIHASGRTIWLYTGYTYEEVYANEEMKALLPYVEVVVDGRFVAGLRDTKLRFRGSSNQRLVVVADSTPDHIVEYQD